MNILAKFFTDFREDFFLAFCSHRFIGEVCVHARTVPVQISKGQMPINGIAVLLTRSSSR